MPLYLDEALEVIRAHGLDWEVKKAWVKVPAYAGGKALKVYLQLPGEDGVVGQIHLSGFCMPHEAVQQVSGPGRVQGIVRTRDNDDATVDEVLRQALALLGPRVPAPARDEPMDASAEAEEEVEPEHPPAMPDIDERTLQDWMLGRVGYGNPRPRGWFLGIEEACIDLAELPARVAGPPVEDLEAALLRIGRYPHLLVPSPALQRTWAPLIRSWMVATSASGTIPTTDEVRAYQRHQWGRSQADHLLAELLPLPSPSVGAWLYTGIGLASRAQYEERWLPRRIKLLADLWASSPVRPRVAVAYGSRHWEHYRQVFGLGDAAGEALWPEDPNWARGFRPADGQAVVLVRHAVAHGTKNIQWEALGNWLRDTLQLTTQGPVRRPTTRISSGVDCLRIEVAFSASVDPKCGRL